MTAGQHQFQFTPPRRWSGGRITLAAAAAILALGGWAFWQSTEHPSRQVALGAAGAAPETMTVYKSPACDCCGKWIAHLRMEGFTVNVVEQTDIVPVKSRLGVPPSVASCHTATIGSYVIEGHVPTEDIMRLLTERPAVVGIAVPGMPTGTPGMDGPKVPYKVVSFDRNGTLATFAER